MKKNLKINRKAHFKITNSQKIAKFNTRKIIFRFYRPTYPGIHTLKLIYVPKFCAQNPLNPVLKVCSKTAINVQNFILKPIYMHQHFILKTHPYTKNSPISLKMTHPCTPSMYVHWPFKTTHVHPVNVSIKISPDKSAIKNPAFVECGDKNNRFWAYRGIFLGDQLRQWR